MSKTQNLLSKRISHAVREGANKHLVLTPENKRSNLVATHACSSILKKWKELHRVQAKIFHVQTSMQGSEPNANIPENISTFELKPFFYANAVLLPTANPPSTNRGSSKEDTLTQSQILKTDDRDQFIASQ